MASKRRVLPRPPPPRPQQKRARHFARLARWPAVFGCRLRRGRLRQHLLEHHLERAGVAAPAVHQKELTVAMENAVVEVDRVGVVIATEGDAELREAEPFAFLSIFLGFRDLPS